MKWRLLVLTLTAAAMAAAGDAGLRVHFVGGTVASVPAKSNARLDVTGADELLFRGGQSEVRIAYRRISHIEYGQTVSRRYAAAILISPVLLLSKSRAHFVTVAYQDEAGRQQALVFRVGKGEIRSVLASLEARTGRRVEYQDIEARKTVKG